MSTVVRFGAPEGNALHPENWVSIDSLIDDDVAANRSRFDDSVLGEDKATTYRKPSTIRLGRRRTRELWAVAFLLAALALAGLFKVLKE